MVNFRDACRWLRQGKKISRPVWEDHSYWKLGVDEIIEYSDGKRAVIHLNQFNANDWEIWEEDCLSNKESEIADVFYKKDVKQFIKGLLSDCSFCILKEDEDFMIRQIKERAGEGLVKDEFE